MVAGGDTHACLVNPTLFEEGLYYIKIRSRGVSRA